MPGYFYKVLGSVNVLAFAGAVYRALLSRRKNKVPVIVTNGEDTFIWIRARDSNYHVMCKLSDALGMPHSRVQVHNADAERSIIPEILELDVPKMVVTLLPLRTAPPEPLQWEGLLIGDPWRDEPEEEVPVDEVITTWLNTLAGAAWQAP